VTKSEDYRARIGVLGLTPIGRASAGKYQFHRARGGRVYPIRDPDDLTEAEREEMIEYYEQQFSLS
jgi:hypothetical protein